MDQQLLGSCFASDMRGEVRASFGTSNVLSHIRTSYASSAFVNDRSTRETTHLLGFSTAHVQCLAETLAFEKGARVINTKQTFACYSSDCSPWSLHLCRQGHCPIGSGSHVRRSALPNVQGLTAAGTFASFHCHCIRQHVRCHRPLCMLRWHRRQAKHALPQYC